MREPDPLTGPVLPSSSPEQVEDALLVLRRNAPTVVAHLKYRHAAAIRFGVTRDFDPPWPPVLEILDRVLDQVAEDLLHRQPVAVQSRKAGRNLDPCAPRLALGLQAVGDLADERPHVDLLWDEDAM